MDLPAVEIKPTTGAAMLTVVVPTFNERDNLPVLVERLHKALTGIDWEVVFVDDNSPDGTAAAARDLAQRDRRVRCIRRLGRRGLAGACIEGMLASSSSYVAVMDGDLQHDESVLPSMLSKLAEGGADIAVGTRYQSGGTAEGLSSRRLWASQVSNALAQRLTGVAASDPMSGFFMATRQALERVAPVLVPEGFKILLDILVSGKGQMKVAEVPYGFAARQIGETKLDLRNILDFAGLLMTKLSGNILPVRFFGYMLVGLSGIAVHLGVLSLALSMDLDFTAAQIVATVAAMTTNFAMNNAFTYRDQQLSGLAALRGLLLFYLICGTGALSNIGIANWLYANQPAWWVAGFAGSLVSAFWNFSMSNMILWRSR